MLFNLLLLAQDIEFDIPNGADGVAAGGGIMSLLCGGVGSMICLVFVLAMVLIPLIGMWKLFEKAGKPGWASIVPFYNYFVLTEIAGMDIMWFFLLLVPCVNIVAVFMIMMNVAKNYGKDATYGILMALFPFIFVPMLGFSDARYTPMKH